MLHRINEYNECCYSFSLFGTEIYSEQVYSNTKTIYFSNSSSNGWSLKNTVNIGEACSLNIKLFYLWSFA